MIDTDKYEGHTEGPWIPQVNSQVCSSTVVHTIIATVEYNHPQNKVLIADAPLLLAEVKRLREGIEHALHIRLRHGQEEGWKELKELIE